MFLASASLLLEDKSPLEGLKIDAPRQELTQPIHVRIHGVGMVF